MGLKKFDVLWLAEMFLQKDAEVSMAGYVWDGRNKESCRRANGGVGVLVNRSLEWAWVVHERGWFGRS